MTGTATIAITRNGASTRLVYAVDFRLKWRFLEPLAVPFFKSAADRALGGLARGLQGAVVAA